MTSIKLIAHKEIDKASVINNTIEMINFDEKTIDVDLDKIFVGLSGMGFFNSISANTVFEQFLQDIQKYIKKDKNYKLYKYVDDYKYKDKKSQTRVWLLLYIK